MRNKLYLILALTLIILALPLISAERYEDNYFRYGTVNTNGELIPTNTAINNVNILGVICSSNNCTTSSERLWNNVLISNNDFIKLIYPIDLLSQFGYGVYVYKQGYIPYEVWATWFGTDPNDPLGPFYNYLTKKESCTSNVNSLNVAYANNIITVNTNIRAPISNAGPLDYIPDEIKSYYSANAKVNLEIKKNNQIVYTDAKLMNLLFSESKPVLFSINQNLQPGTYIIKVYTTVTNNDEPKCLNYAESSMQYTLTIPEPPEPPECTYNSDCGTNHYSENYCENNNVYKNKHQPVCNQGNCEETITKELVHTCDYGCNIETKQCNPQPPVIICNQNSDCGTDGCAGGFNYCGINNNVYQDFIYFTCHNPGQTNSYCTHQTLPFLIYTCGNDYYSDKHCFNNNLYKDFHDFSCLNAECVEDVTKQLTDICSYGCNSTTNECNPQPPQPVCTQSSDCGTNSYIGDKFCKSDGNVYQNYKTFTCNNPNTSQSSCSSSITENKIQTCNYGCNSTTNTCKPQPPQPICQIDIYCGQSSSKNICKDNNLFKEITTPKCVFDILTLSNKCENQITYTLVEECLHGACEIRNTVTQCKPSHSIQKSNTQKGICYDDEENEIDCDELYYQQQLALESSKKSDSIKETLSAIENINQDNQSSSTLILSSFSSITKLSKNYISYIIYITTGLLILILIIILIILATRTRKPRKR